MSYYLRNEQLKYITEFEIAKNRSRYAEESIYITGMYKFVDSIKLSKYSLNTYYK